MRTKLCFGLLLGASIATGYAQTDWRELISDEDANFHEIQQKFYEEFGDQPGERGTGWKQFKRWEHHWQFRVDEQGNFPSKQHLLNAILSFDNNNRNYATGTGNWTELGPVAKPINGTGQPNGNGRLSCIAFHPTDANTLYVGAASGGFWMSSDNGQTWSKSIAGLIRLGVNSIVVDPNNPNTIFIGTGDRDGNNAPGYGVWKSTDGGATWASSNNGMGNRTVYEVLMDPTNPLRMIASTSSGRIYRTTDGGANWAFTAVSSNCKDIAFKPGDPNTIYAAGATVNVSTDGGATFTQITSGLPSASRFALAVSPNQPDWVYAVAGNGTGLIGVYRSTNSGQNYSTRTTTPNILGYSSTGNDNNSQAWYDLVMSADPTDANKIFIGGINIWKSTDGGSTFSISAHWTGSGGSPAVHADQHVLEYSPHNNALYNGNDGGIYFTTNEGASWTERSAGLGISQIYKIGVAQSEENLVIAGFQDNGTAIYNNGTWTTEIGGDGMECLFDPTDANYVYGELYYGDIKRSTNGGINFSDISNVITETGGWVTPYKLDPNNVNTMYAGFDNVWRSTNIKTGAPTWTLISSFTGTSNLVDIAIAPSNSDVIYASRASNGERFFVTNNASAGTPTWTNISGNLPVNSTPKDIEIDPTDPTHLFVAIGNDIYESTNSGSSWTNYAGTLPNISLNTIVIDPNSSVDAMYVGMDVGVYYRDNNQSDWSLYSTGIPNVEVTELEIYNNPSECRSKLYAATYGQGVWVSDLKDPGNVSPTACFRANITDVCASQVVTLTDNSDFTPTSWNWNITPASFTFVGGTSATSQNPQIQFTAAGNYTIELTATNAHGVDSETKASYITVSPAANASTFSDDFESYSLCATASNCGTTICNLGSNWKNMTNGTDDQVDWRVDESGTPSGGTGPSIDMNPGTSVGNYAYIEASSCFGRTAILESDCILLDVDYSFELGYHMAGTDMGELHIDIFAAGVWNNDITSMISGDQGTNWQAMTVDLSSWTGQAVRLRIRGISGNGYQSDVAIDDIKFTPITPLPVSLMYFEPTLENNSRVRLAWETAAEMNSDHFVIQRSANGVEWENILTTPAAGNSSETMNYTEWDMNPLPKTSYYRLLMVDMDGSTAYSNMKSIHRTNPHEIEVYPNPANDWVFIKGVDIEKSDINIVNALGQSILVNQSSEIGKYAIQTGSLPNGVYLIQVTQPDGKIQTKRLVIRH